MAQLKVAEKPAWTPERDGANEPTSQRANEGRYTDSESASDVGATSPVGAIAGVAAMADAGATSRSRISSEPIRRQEAAPTVTLAKSGQGVELAWTGNPRGEYVVYRCTSPKFDPRVGECSVAAVVKGTRWMDSEPGSRTITYYRVEPNAGG